MIIRRTILAAFFLLLAAGGNALAMSQSATPLTFPVPWGASAGSNYIRVIPQASQIGIQNCAASLTDGFPPLTFTPSNQGGCPPFGQDMNGILNQLSLWSQWQEAGAPVYYSSAFSSAIGGYPKGAVLASAATVGCFWSSVVDNNTSDPDTGGANWNGYCTGLAAAGGTSTGSGNSQVVTVSPFVLQTGAVVHFKAAFSNTGPLQVNVNGAGLANVYRISQFGPSMSVGGEVLSGNMVDLEWDGAEWQCQSCAFATVGEEKSFTGGTVPLGWLIEDGSCYSRTTYATLFAYYGSIDLWATQAGSSCSGSQFAVPKANGRLAVAVQNQGAGTGPLTNCTAGVTVNCGAQSITQAQNQLPNIVPSFSGGVDTLNNIGVSGNILVAATGGGIYICQSSGDCPSLLNNSGEAALSGYTVTPTGTISSINGGVTQQPMNIVPLNYQVYKAVKY